MTVQQDGVDDTPQLKEYAQRCLRLAYTAQSPLSRTAREDGYAVDGVVATDRLNLEILNSKN